MRWPRCTAHGLLRLAVMGMLLVHQCLATGDVVVLTDANFDSLLRGRGGVWLIDIYSPGYADCQMYAAACMHLLMQESLGGRVKDRVAFVQVPVLQAA